MTKSIVILQGHPDTSKSHLCHALAEAYAKAAQDAGHTVHQVTVADLDFPVLRSEEEWTEGPTPAGLRETQQLILEADHLVILFPLWLGSLPALLKVFFEQILRPSLNTEGNNPLAWRRLMKGCSARIVCTMGMPAFVYRLIYRAHGVKFLKRNILAFTGVGPIRTSYFGMVEGASESRRAGWLKKMAELGRSVR